MTEGHVDDIVAECGRYWSRTGVMPETIAEMKAELESHLREAEKAGKSPEAVIGGDVATFAETWAAEHRGPAPKPNPPSPTRTETTKKRNKRWTWVAAGVILVILVAVAALAPKEDTVDTTNWQLIWVGVAVLLGIGELLTAGFFLLPFAVGAAGAALLAFLGVDPLIQLLVFIVVSVLFLVVLQRYARREEELEPTQVGANRYLDRRAVVFESVNRITGTGRVRMETEDWRATTDLNDEIAEGTEVRVVDVRGTRLVVEPLDDETEGHDEP